MKNDTYYKYSRTDLLNFIPKGNYESMLDIGCGEGYFAKNAKEIFNIKYAAGIEYTIEASQKASEKIDKVYNGDANQILENNLIDGKFDLIVLGDVLEHLVDPWKLIKNLNNILNDNGFIIASVPNLSHYVALKYILKDKWLYTDAGILDRTHLRFFTKSTFIDLFESNNYEIIKFDVEGTQGLKAKTLKLFCFGKLKLIWNGKYYAAAIKRK